MTSDTPAVDTDEEWTTTGSVRTGDPSRMFVRCASSYDLDCTRVALQLLNEFIERHDLTFLACRLLAIARRSKLERAYSGSGVVERLGDELPAARVAANSPADSRHVKSRFDGRQLQHRRAVDFGRSALLRLSGDAIRMDTAVEGSSRSDGAGKTH